MFGCFFLYICTGCVKKSCCKIIKKYFYQPVEKVYIALTRQEETETRSGLAGPSFSVRPEKEAKGAVLHGTSAAERLRHVETRSAGRTKTRRLTALKQFVRPFFHRAKRDEKIPSRATQIIAAGAPRPSESAQRRRFRKRSEAMLFCALFSLKLDRQAKIFLFFCFSLFFFFMRL